MGWAADHSISTLSPLPTPIPLLLLCSGTNVSATYLWFGPQVWLFLIHLPLTPPSSLPTDLVLEAIPLPGVPPLWVGPIQEFHMEN